MRIEIEAVGRRRCSGYRWQFGWNRSLYEWFDILKRLSKDYKEKQYSLGVQLEFNLS